MSKESWLFEGEDGQTAFLAGVVDCLSESLSMICDFGFTLDADIFYIKDNDFSVLNETIKKRLHTYSTINYWDSEKKEYTIDITDEEIDSLSFKLYIADYDVKKYLCERFSQYSSSEDIVEKVDKYLSDLRWHLGEPLCICHTIEETEESFARNLKVLGRIYLYMAFEYFFIVYDEYIVLFIFGTVE